MLADANEVKSPTQFLNPKKVEDVKANPTDAEADAAIMMKDLEALLVDCRKEAENVQKEKESSPSRRRRSRSKSRSPHRSGRDDRRRKSPHRSHRDSRYVCVYFLFLQVVCAYFNYFNNYFNVY